MKKTLILLAALGALTLSSCSSDDGSGATPGNGSSTPQATKTDSNPGGSGSGFCDIVSNSAVIKNDLVAANDDLSAITADQANWNSPEAVAALHTYGKAMLESSNKVVAIYRQAAREANDPAVSQAFLTLADFFDLMYKAMGQAAVEADSVTDFQMSWMMSLDQDQMQSLANDLDETGPLIANYISETCGITGFGDIPDF